MLSSSAARLASTSEREINERIHAMQKPLAGTITNNSGRGVARRPVTVAPPDKVGRKHLYVLGLSSVAAIGGFLFGFDSGVVNGTVDALSAAFGTKAAATGFAV